MKENNKYHRLLSNTFLFGISTFSSKVLSFALTRLYTGVMAEASFGLADLIISLANLLIPLVSLGISNSVIRFGLEKDVSKAGVFTGGLTAIGGGFGILLLFMPLISKISGVGGYIILLYAYVLSSCLRTLCHQFVRARMLTRLYAIDGILSTLYTLGFSVLFLYVLKMDIVGYLLSIICADLLSAAFLFIVGKIGRYLDFKQLDFKLLKKMLRYSLPLVPASMSWWVTNASDRFFITAMLGAAANGLYAAAYKIPSIVTILSTIFTEAWQLSAITDGQDGEREKFFTSIFQALMAVAFLVGGFLIILCQPIMRILVGKDYFEAWVYIPVLILATTFSCLVNFQNSVYMLEKRSNLSLVTMVCGAAANLILNGPMIKLMGAQGAGVATFISYLLVFIIRAYSTRKYIKVDYKPVKVMLNTMLLLTEGIVLVTGQKYSYLWCSILLAILLAVNFGSLYRGVIGLIGEKMKKKK